MGTATLHYVRRRQILHTLLEHGPLTTQSLSAIIRPKMSPRGIQLATKRLYDRGLIVRVHAARAARSGHYYQVSHSLEARPQVERLLDLATPLKSKASFRGQDLYHSEAAALWSERLKRELPGATILREHHFQADRDLRESLQLTHSEFDLKPDILIRSPRTRGQSDVVVAVEIERFSKTVERLEDKLRKLAGGTKLDGLIYVCYQHASIRSIRRIYLSQVQEIHHAKPFGQNFLLLSSDAETRGGSRSPMLDLALNPISLDKWMSVLRRTNNDTRTDADFKDVSVERNIL